MLQPAKTAIDILRALPKGRLQEKIFFMHLPKCGGSSIARAIQNAYGFRGRLKQWMFGISPGSSHQAADLLGMPTHIYRELLLLYAMGHPQYRFIKGHVQYSEAAFEAFGDSWKFITVFRDPVSKWFSEYFYNRHKSSPHAKILAELPTFVASEAANKYGNDYVRYLVSDKERTDWDSEEAIENAIANLDHFAVVGILEDMDRFVTDFRKRFGTELYIGRQNRNPVAKRRQADQITEDIKQEVERICRPNLAIYHHARRKLAEAL